MADKKEVLRIIYVKIMLLNKGQNVNLDATFK